MAFDNHWQRKLTPLPRLGRGATISGTPAWQVAEERRKQAEAHNAPGA